MPLTPLDGDRLREALALAEQSIGLSDPNPRVGCVIGGEDGSVLGRGYTQEAGGPHAEIVALRDAQAAGKDVRGATVWVTLEPCAHHGRTPPCCDALIAAGVARVVVAVGDPNPLVAGAGLARLRAAGIEVVMGDDAIADAARELNIGFFSRMERGRPWVRAKVAISLDGRTALENGLSQWITGEESRIDGHKWRRRASAVLTGSGTVLADDPRLDVRHVPTTLQPVRVLIDSTLRCPPTSRIFDPPGAAWVATRIDRGARADMLRARDVELLVLPAGPHGVDTIGLLSELSRRGVNELHVEAGAGLNGVLHAASLVDEWLVYVAPRWLGPGREAIAMAPLVRLSQSSAMRWIGTKRVGDDLLLRLRPR